MTKAPLQQFSRELPKMHGDPNDIRTLSCSLVAEQRANTAD